jgi:hypothetical protein
MRLNLGQELSLPAEDLLESAIGIIGKRGRGKSGGVKVLMEELIKANLPFVAFDPVGVMWGIRSSVDGTGPGLPVLIVGGSHGDVRLDRRAGNEIARAIVQANISCIVDFSEEPKAAYREFVKDFSHTLFSVNDTPRMVIIEEAPELVPQRMRPDMTAVFEAVERLVSRGRNKGIGVTLVSQRAATINKDVLTQVDALFVFGLTSPQDRKALTEWVQAKDDEGHLKDFENGIAGLKRQEAWFWSPEAFGGKFSKVRIRDFTTFHPDKTHLRRTGLLKAKPVTTDISGIVQKLGTHMDSLSKEKAEVSSIPRMQRRIRQLEAQLEKAKTVAPHASPERIHAAISDATKTLKEENARLKEQLLRTDNLSESAKRAITILTAAIGDGSDTRPKQKDRARNIPLAREQRYSGQRQTDMRSGERRILERIASRHPLTLTRAQLGTLSGFTPSGGTFQTYFSDLKRRGYISENHAKEVTATEEGLEYLGEVPLSPNTHEGVMAMWKRNLRSGEGRILQKVVDIYPNSIDKRDLADSTEFTFSGGTFQTYLGILKRNGLVEQNGDDIRATEVLFP